MLCPTLVFLAPASAHCFLLPFNVQSLLALGPYENTNPLRGLLCHVLGSGARLHPLADWHTVLSAPTLICGQLAGLLLIHCGDISFWLCSVNSFYQCCVAPSQRLAKEHTCANTAISPTKGVISAESTLGFVWQDLFYAEQQCWLCSCLCIPYQWNPSLTFDCFIWKLCLTNGM